MLFLGIISILLAIALSPLHIPAIYLHRITIGVLLYGAVLALNPYVFGPLGASVGVYNGLFQVSPITISFDGFIYLAAALILQTPVGGCITGSSSSQTAAPLQRLYREYSFVVLFTLLGMSALISSIDLVSMFLAIELQSLAVYILATMYRESETATAAGLKYFLLGGLSSALIALGAALVYAYTGLTGFESLYVFSTISTGASFALIPPSAMLVIGIGFLFKIGAAPMHNWAPDVYDGVPTYVTAWLATMPKISFIVFLAQYLPIVLGRQGGSLILLSALLSLAIGSIVGLAQYRLKRLLAYSTISHVGFMLLALGTNSALGADSCLFYLLQYTLTNLNVFCIIIAMGSDRMMGSSLSSSPSPIQYIAQLKGHFQINPAISISLAICLFSMAGIPPLLGFFGKLQVLNAALYNGNYFMAIVAILVSVISAAYYLRVIKVMHFDSAAVSDTLIADLNTETASGPGARVGATFGLSFPYQSINILQAYTISVLTIGIVLFMLYPTILLSLVHLAVIPMYCLN